MNEDATTSDVSPWSRQAETSVADNSGPGRGGVAATSATPASGWYPDPADPARQRFWDGAHWTAETRSISLATVPASPVGASAANDPYAATAPAAATAPGDPYAAAAGMRPTPLPSGPAPVPTYPTYANPYLSAAAAPGYSASLAPGVARTADGVALAGWWWRVLATVLDSVIVGLVAGTVLMYTVFSGLVDLMTAWVDEVIQVIQANSTALPPLPAELVPLENKYALALAAANFVYCVVLLAWRGGTLGQLICGLRVVPSGQGRHQGGLPWGTAVVRVAVYLALTGVASAIFALAAPELGASLGGLFLILTLLTWLWPLWQPGRRGLQDLAARTQVVRP